MISKVLVAVDGSEVTESPISFDCVCTCKLCERPNARDCLKVGCNCCNDNNHSMILDGIEGFPPTQ